jgi:uncharacterized repeat protein (TIGR03806 family)
MSRLTIFANDGLQLTCKYLVAVALILLLPACGGGGSSSRDSMPPPPPPTGETGLEVRPANVSCVAPERPSGVSGVSLERVFPALSFQQPVYALQAPNTDAHWYVLEKAGRLWRFANDQQVTNDDRELVLDYSAVVNDAVEGGLLGMAFAPDFAQSGHVYLSYTTDTDAPGQQMRSVLSRFHTNDAGRTLTVASEQQILTIEQPRTFHNGGGIKFGPDGYLYLGLGDGGEWDESQNNHNLLGTFVRIDVSGGGAQYAIPADNPFAGNPLCSTGAGSADCPEIFAWGLRNPWRWSFDEVTGDLWAGDVGQSAREEINLIISGGNYGWPHREGMICFRPPSNCLSEGLVDPVIDYLYSEELGAVTGGYVYRGNQIPELRGQYVFGDFGSGRIWALEPGADGYVRRELVNFGGNIPSFARGNDGELYVVAFGGGLYRLEADSSPGNNTIPELLSETGCRADTDTTLPSDGLIPFAPAAPFWSDAADKHRWMALPDGASIGLAGDGNFQYPAGSVLVKDFERDNRLIETRLLMRHPDGEWAGYTYQWNESQTEAARVIGGAQVEIAGEPWIFPSEAQCLQCHTVAAGRTLGLELAQLNSDLLYPQTGLLANQLASLDHINLFSAGLPDVPANLPALQDPEGVGDLDDRARAYLHTNCAGCHRPGGPTASAMDLRFDRTLSQMQICDVPAQSGSTLGIENARLLAPGDVDRSLIWVRMGRRDAHGMPPMGSVLVDETGRALIAEWISQLGSCS